MSFTGIGFLIFLATVVSLCSVGSIPKTTKKVLLILFSCWFYGYGAPMALAWLFLSAAVTYALSLALFKTPEEKAFFRRILLGAGVVFHILFLSFFKYVDLSSLRALLGDTLVLFVPLGVSFFTFQFIVYLIEVYRKKDAPSSPLDFALFSVFFPYRTMGPIMTHASFCAELNKEDALCSNASRISRGLFQFILGMTKKLVLADTLALLANNAFALTGDVSFLAAWGGALSYTFQLYFDFSGYSDMAMGVGEMLGISLPQNFDSPYKSESVSVFWRRWHMTLGRALTTSVYISLGGNRRGTVRTCINLFCVMAVSGIWHGDTVNFLLWGGAYGLLLILERLAAKPLEKIPLPLRRVGTFLTVLLLWVPFRAPTFEGAARIWRGMLNVTNPGIAQFAALSQNDTIPFPTPLAILYGGGLLLLSGALCFFCKNSVELTQKTRLNTKTAFFLAVLILLCVIHMSRASVFLYENF